MKRRFLMKLAAWLMVLSLTCGQALAAYVPGTPETAEPVPEVTKPVPEVTEDPAPPEAEAEAAELLDADGNVELTPYSVNGTQQGYYVSGCPSDVTNAVIPAERNGYPVDSIAKGAFKNHHNLVSVVIPDSVKTIGEEAFYGCDKLSGLTLPVSVSFLGNNNFSCQDKETPLALHFTAGTGTMPTYSISGEATVNYYGWAPWTSANSYGKPVTVTFGEGVANVGAYAFYNCGVLQSVTMGKSLTAAGDFAFCDCTGLTDASFLTQLDSIGVSAFQGCTGIPEIAIKPGVTALPESVFSRCHSLKTVVLPDSVRDIGPYAFYECKALSDLTLPVSAVFCGQNNFCCQDTETPLAVRFTKGTGVMPDYSYTVDENTVNYLGWTPWSSASNNGKPTDVVFDEGIKNIGAYAFYLCDDLRSVTMGKSLTSVGDYAFTYCSGLTDVSFITQLDKLGVSAFQDCDGIAEIAIKPGVTALPASVFEYCDHLKTVVLPDSVKDIAPNAFYECKALSNLTLPVSAVFHGDNNYCCQDTETPLTVRFTKGTGVMPDYSYTLDGNTVNYLGWTPWFSASSFGKPTTVVFDQGVETIGAYVFYNCDDIKSLSLPTTLTRVAVSATQGCSSLDTVYYSGTVEQWAAITILSYNDPLLKTGTVVYVKSTQVTVLDSGGNPLTTAAFPGLPECTVVCTLYDARGQFLSGELKASDAASFTTVNGAVRVRLLFLSGTGLVPVRAAETLLLETA